MLRIAAGIQVLQVRVGAVNARLHGAAQEKHRRRCAVIGAAAGVLRQAAAEFRKHRHEHAPGMARLGQVIEESLQRTAQLLHQAGVRAKLVGVRVKAAELRVADGSC